MQKRLRSSPVEETISLKSSVTGCMVRHLTKFGAHIEVPPALNVPERFNMTFDGGYSVRPCRLLWEP